MNLAFRLAASLILLTGFAALAAAQSLQKPLAIADLTSHPETANGRVVEISARVIAISADSKSMELFDSDSKTTIQVRLAQLPKSERSVLMQSDVRRVTVTGRAWMVSGRMVIDAQKVEALAVDTADNVREETVPVVGGEGPR